MASLILDIHWPQRSASWSAAAGRVCTALRHLFEQLNERNITEDLRGPSVNDRCEEASSWASGKMEHRVLGMPMAKSEV